MAAQSEIHAQLCGATAYEWGKKGSQCCYLFWPIIAGATRDCRPSIVQERGGNITHSSFSSSVFYYFLPSWALFRSLKLA